MVRTVLLVAAIVTAVAGCATWQHPTATEADFHRDSYQCHMETARAFPAARTPMGPGYQAPTRINCTRYGSQTDCTARPGVYVPPPVMDTNAGDREAAFDSCMRARGYTQ